MGIMSRQEVKMERNHTINSFLGGKRLLQDLH